VLRQRTLPSGSRLEKVIQNMQKQLEVIIRQQNQLERRSPSRYAQLKCISTVCTLQTV
jgi:hypothetical protein